VEQETGERNRSVIEVANQQLDLRDWLVQVKQLGELVEIEGVHWDKEMGALTQIVHERSTSSPPALLFSKVPGYPDGFRTLYGSLSSVKRLALSLGISSDDDQKISLLKEFRAKVETIKPIAPRTVSRGPIFENVLEGDRVNVLKFPVPKHHEQDPARFIATACAVVLKHPDEGWFNIGTYRSMVYSETEIGLEMSPTSDGGRIQKLYLDRKEPMPVVICVGQHPLIYLVGSTKHNLPEYDVAGGILGAPVDVVEGPFTGFPIPAHAEIVLEGLVHPDKMKPEGPFGEWMGYYASDVVDRPYVEVKTVLHRNDPILTCAPQHKPPDETVLLRSLATSAKAWQALEDLGVRGVKGVWQHEGGASKKFLVVSLEQHFTGHARQALHVAAASAGAIFGGKWVIVVDDDIDPTNMTEVTWALCTRVNGLDDFDFIQKAPSGGLIDPLTGDYFNTHILVDACIPYGQKASGKFPQAVTVSKELTDSLLDRWGMRFEQWFKS
jgi:UbiD family decarboxylase